jgi:hypothetical protein
MKKFHALRAVMIHGTLDGEHVGFLQSNLLIYTQFQGNCRRGKGRDGTMNYVKIVKSEDRPETKEILAEAIIRISAGLTALTDSGLNEEAIVILVSARSRLRRDDVRLVLRSLARLRGWYCRETSNENN